MSKIYNNNSKRQCGDCSTCCEGWVQGEAHGHKFWPGRKCHFLNDTGCTIYKDRPEDPCKTYQCEWLADTSFPEWMRPDLSKVIITKRKTPAGEIYYDAIEAGEKMDATILSWILQKYISEDKDIVYRLSGGQNYFASEKVARHVNKDL